MSERIRTRTRNQIDLNKPIPVQWPNDSSSLAFEESEAEDFNGAGPVAPTPKGDIPIPGVRILPEYEAEAEIIKGFARPSRGEYVTFPRLKDEIDLFVEYELEDQDEMFLHEELRDPKIDEVKLELILDWLEKESFKRREYRQIKLQVDTSEKMDTSLQSDQGDEDVPCSVCNDREWEDGNAIVFCDGCSIAVHQDCVGLPDVPEGEWLCDRCQYLHDWDAGLRDAFDSEAQDAVTPPTSRGGKQGTRGRRKSVTPGVASSGVESNDEDDAVNSSRGSGGAEQRPVVSCIACPDLTGAFRRTNKPGKWIHIVCALYIPEMVFMEDGVVDIRGMEPRRATLCCEVCQGMGGCVQCAVTRCCHSYHVTCARSNGQLVRTKVSKKTEQFNYETFCPQHSITKRNEEIRKAKEVKEVPVQLGVFLDDYTWEEIDERVLPALLGLPAGQHGVSEKTFAHICDFWKRKRYARQNGRRPYIYRLQVAVEEDRVEFDAGRRWQRNERRGGVLLQSSDFDKFHLMRQLREGFERTRLLIDLIRGRELKKKKKLKTLRDAFSAVVRRARLSKDVAFIDEDSQMSNSNQYETVSVKEIADSEAATATDEMDRVEKSRKRRREEVATPVSPPPIKPKIEHTTNSTSMHTPAKIGQAPPTPVATSLSPHVKPALGPSATKKYSKAARKLSTPSAKTPSRKEPPAYPVAAPSPIVKPHPSPIAKPQPSPIAKPQASPVRKSTPQSVPQADPIKSLQDIELKRDDDEDGEVDIDGDGDRRVNRSRGEAPAPGYYADAMDVDGGDEDEEDGEFAGAVAQEDDSLDEVVLLDASPHAGRKRRKLNDGAHVDSTSSKAQSKSPLIKGQDNNGQTTIKSFFQRIKDRFLN